MSDFLTSLIQRQERPTGLVQPRIPSLFETSGPRLAPEMGLREESREIEATAPRDAESGPVVRAAQSEATTREPIYRDTPPRPHAYADTAQPQSAIAAIRTRPVIEIAEETTQAPFAMPQRRDPAPREANAEAPAPFAPPANAVATNTVVTSTQRESAITPAAEKTVRVESTVEIRPQTTAPQPAPFAPETPRAQAPFETPDAPRTVTQQQPFMSPPQPPRAPAPRQTSIPAQLQAEPIIHVTIGRIEVRAVEEREARPRKREAASPVMTLDDYLKSRAKR
jgi:hypothetical protein